MPIQNTAPIDPFAPREGRECAATDDACVYASEGFESSVLLIARHIFATFARPGSHSWIDAFDEAERVFPAPFGATIAHAIVVAINALRSSRRRPFVFELPDPTTGQPMTDNERYFIMALRDVRRGNTASARTHGMLLCEGNDPTDVLVAFDRLAVITGESSGNRF